MNCLRPGHFSKQCQSINRCRRCHKPHHTILHVETPTDKRSTPLEHTVSSSHTATGVTSNTLLMTFQAMVKNPDGSSVKACALLDSGSSASFVSEQLAQGLHLPRSRHNLRISGVAGLTNNHHHNQLQPLKSPPSGHLAKGL